MKVLNGDIVTAFFKSERGKMTLGSLFHKQRHIGTRKELTEADGFTLALHEPHLQ